MDDGRRAGWVRWWLALVVALVVSAVAETGFVWSAASGDGFEERLGQLPRVAVAVCLVVAAVWVTVLATRRSRAAPVFAALLGVILGGLVSYAATWGVILGAVAS